MSPSEVVSFPISQQTKWEKRFLGLSAVVASWSEDSSRQVGAVIVGPFNEVRSVGFNGLPRKISAANPIRHQREGDVKYHWYEHAERNAIYNSARVGTPVDGCVMYTNLFPCSDCARAIIQSGIVRLVSYAPPENDAKYSSSFDFSIEMMVESGVELKLFKIGK